MRRLIQFIVSAVVLLMILLGSRYAIARDSLSRVDLHLWYQQINRESFDGKLPDVAVSWSDLPDKNAGMTDFDEDTPVSIELDRREIESKEVARRVLRHEACHVFAGPVGHSYKWQTCMRRFRD